MTGTLPTGARPLNGRTLYCNAYVEDDEHLFLVVYNPKERFWSLPGCAVRDIESPRTRAPARSTWSAASG